MVLELILANQVNKVKVKKKTPILNQVQLKIPPFQAIAAKVAATWLVTTIMEVDIKPSPIITRQVKLMIKIWLALMIIHHIWSSLQIAVVHSLN